MQSSKRKMDSNTGQTQLPNVSVSYTGNLTSSSSSSMPLVQHAGSPLLFTPSTTPSQPIMASPLPFATEPSLSANNNDDASLSKSIRSKKSTTEVVKFNWRGHLIGTGYTHVNNAIRSYTHSEQEAIEFIHGWRKMFPKTPYEAQLMIEHAPKALIKEVTDRLPPSKSSTIIPTQGITLADDLLSTLIEEGKDNLAITFSSKNTSAVGSLEEVKTETTKTTVLVVKSFFRLQSELVQAQESTSWKDSIGLNEITLPEDMVVSKEALERFIDAVYNFNTLGTLLKSENAIFIVDIAILSEYFQCNALNEKICSMINSFFDSSSSTSFESMFKEYKKLLSNPNLNLKAESSFLNRVKKLALPLVTENSIVDLDENALIRLLSCVFLSEERKLQLIKHWCDQHDKSNVDRIKLARVITHPATYMPFKIPANALSFLKENLGAVGDEHTKAFMQETMFLPPAFIPYNSWPYGDETQYSIINSDYACSIDLRIKLTAEEKMHLVSTISQDQWGTTFPAFKMQEDEFFFRAIFTRNYSEEGLTSKDAIGIHFHYMSPNPARFFRSPEVTNSLSIITKRGKKEPLARMTCQFSPLQKTNSGFVHTFFPNKESIHNAENPNDSYLWVHADISRSKP